jgi:hypothetical protein
MKLTDTLTLKERDKAAASILAGQLRGDVRFKGRRWYLWNDAENRWERATVARGVTRRIIGEIQDLITQAVIVKNYEEAHAWTRYLDPSDVGTRLTPRISRILRAH